MTTHSKRDLSIDSFNLPPLSDQRNAMDSYLMYPTTSTPQMARTEGYYRDLTGKSLTARPWMVMKGL